MKKLIAAFLLWFPLVAFSGYLAETTHFCRYIEAIGDRSLFDYAVDKDWIGKNGVIRTTLGKVDVADNRATAQVILDGQVAPNRFEFTKEDGVWKFDLIHVIHDG